MVFVWLDGGASQFETFDPKPAGLPEIRGAAGAIPTSIPGLQLSALMPRLARRMNSVALIRTISHGEFCHGRARERMLAPGHPLLPAGQVIAFSAGGARVDSASHIGGFECECRNGLLRLSGGERNVYFEFGGWDHHAEIGRGAGQIVPELDRGLASLIDGLQRSGLLSRTLLVVMSEFGRSARLNVLGGRDHNPGCGFALLAGAGIPGGRVIGKTDDRTGEARSRPISPEELWAAIEVRVNRRPARFAAGRALPELA